MAYGARLEWEIENKINERVLRKETQNLSQSITKYQVFQNFEEDYPGYLVRLKGWFLMKL